MGSTRHLRAVFAGFLGSQARVPVDASTSLAISRDTQRGVALLVVSCMLAIAWPTRSFATAADQTRRTGHFNWLQARGVFQSMGVVNGVPQLVLGAGKGKADPYALGVFCQVIYQYFSEKDPTVTQMAVIDGPTGAIYATVDASGYHKN